MPMEGWVKGLRPQNTFGVSGAKSNTIEVTGDQVFKHKKQEKKTYTHIYTTFLAKKSATQSSDASGCSDANAHRC